MIFITALGVAIDYRIHRMQSNICISLSKFTYYGKWMQIKKSFGTTLTALYGSEKSCPDADTTLHLHKSDWMSLRDMKE